MAECHSSVSGTKDLETCGWDPDPYSNQLKPKLLLLEPVPKVCTCKNPVPQEDANADKTILHVFHRADVDQLHVAIH